MEETENPEQLKIVDLDIDEEYKALLAFMIKERNIHEISEYMKMGQTKVYNVLGIWQVRKWVIKLKRSSGGHLYKTNLKVLSP